jgi:succinoglycan biosynthesis protein ExoM
MTGKPDALTPVLDSPPPLPPRIDICVVIPTYRRPPILQSAIGSILAQEGLTEPVELLVVDNDPGRSAESCVREIARNSPIPVRYLSEPRAGISHARNAGVTAANSRYLAFLDDDEEAPPDWLANLRSTAGRYNADVVVGPVRPCFPDVGHVPAYAKRIYNRDALVATGEIVQWGGIGNSLLDRERCFRTKTPFDPRFGLSGGEDAVFLARLQSEGRRCVWCAEASVTETIPLAKIEAGYLLRRAFRGGQTTAYLPSTGERPKIGGVVRWMAIGAAQVCIYGPWAALLLLARRKEWLDVMATAASGLGKVLWHPGLHLRNYRIGGTTA